MAKETTEIALKKRLEQKVLRFVRGRELWPEDESLLVAVSGGADSTALSVILNRLARGRSLHIAHFDHGLRTAEEATREANFVRQLGASLGIEVVTGRGDVRARAKQDGTSIENAARLERYEYLAATAKSLGVSAVATGHTASDQAETVLQHLIRGSGLQGLAGMAAASAWPIAGVEELRLVRPLLCLTREETEAYCEASGLEPIQDPSNHSAAYERNRIRHELLPLLRTFNPRIEDALVRLSAIVQEARDDAATDGEAVREAARLVLGRNADIERAHVEAVLRLAKDGRTGDSVDLPKGLRVRRQRDAVTVSRPSRRTAIQGEVTLDAGCMAVLAPFEVRYGDAPLEHAIAAAEVDAEIAASGFVVRGRKPGDRFQPLGMQQSKKLQDFFVDAHLPREERDAVPIFETEKGIVWVGGLRIAEWAKPRAGIPSVTLSYRLAT